MSTTKVIAVFDIGKTNKKILLFDQNLKVVYQHEQKFATTADEDGIECDDIKKIQVWMVDSLKSIITNGDFDVVAVNFSTYGASLAFINQKGELLTPIYNYLKEIDGSIQDVLFTQHGGLNEFCRRTASPALGLMLNSGIQMLWLKKEKAHIWKDVENVLHFPQYLSYVLTGQVLSEPTSIGCHTFMWDFDQMEYHPWISQEGITLPQPVNNDKVLEATIGGHAFKTGVGIHDSSASLVPYLENSKKKFILVSTGTWCISMNPFNAEPLTSEQLSNDCLCFLTPQKQQVKSSRLFMGHFHEKLLLKLNVHFNIDANYFKSVSYQSDLVQMLNKRFGDKQLFFPEGITAFDGGLDKIDLSVFQTFDEAYTRMVMELTKLCIASIKLIIPANDETEILYVSGGFARNPIYLNLLKEHFTDKTVYTSEIDNASALGAALVIAEGLGGFNCNAIALTNN